VDGAYGPSPLATLSLYLEGKVVATLSQDASGRVSTVVIKPDLAVAVKIEEMTTEERYDPLFLWSLSYYARLNGFGTRLSISRVSTLYAPGLDDDEVPRAAAG